MLGYQLLSTLRLIVKLYKQIKMSSAIFGHTARIYRMIRRSYCHLRNLLTTIVNPALLESAHSLQIQSSTPVYNFLFLKLPDLLLGSELSRRKQIRLLTT